MDPGWLVPLSHTLAFSSSLLLMAMVNGLRLIHWPPFSSHRKARRVPAANYRPEVWVRGRESFDLWEAVITIWVIALQLMVKDSKPSCYESWLWEESRSRFL